MSLHLVHDADALSVRAAPPVAVFNEDFVDRLHKVNVACRRLRAWDIEVSAIELHRNGTRPPHIHIEREATRSLAPLLDATQGNRTWLPTKNDHITIALAMLDGVTIQWEQVCD
ncbi:hypothetical protein FACS1894116_12650 [Betaproteobacteria bacterium]|nr:hypothetical protein FACS1894116_12650 [Betaproteobacteria bacterium]GHU26737.1 hypothetical protein FACS189488_14900 [Betaproteobacteria bacterium]